MNWQTAQPTTLKGQRENVWAMMKSIGRELERSGSCSASSAVLAFLQTPKGLGRVCELGVVHVFSQTKSSIHRKKRGLLLAEPCSALAARGWGHPECGTHQNSTVTRPMYTTLCSVQCLSDTFTPATPPCHISQRNNSTSEGEAVLGHCQRHSRVALPRLSLPLDAAAHEVCVHTRHGHANTLPLELAAVVPGVPVPARHTPTSTRTDRHKCVCGLSSILCVGETPRRMAAACWRPPHMPATRCHQHPLPSYPPPKKTHRHRQKHTNTHRAMVHACCTLTVCLPVCCW